MSPLSIVLLVARYPPDHEAVAELRAAELARELARRGHAVHVLTSSDGRTSTKDESGVRVERALSVGDDRTRGLGSIASDCRRLRSALNGADVLVVSHATGLPLALLAVAQDFGRTCFDVASDWLRDAGSPHHAWYERWRPPAGGATIGYRMKRGSAEKMLGIPVRPVTVPFGRSWFWSRERWRRCLAAGLAVHGSTVLTPGVDVRRFGFAPRPPPGETVRVLFVDQVHRECGLRTVVLAVGDLPDRVRLRVAGKVKDAEYLYETAEIGRAAGSVDRIEIVPAVKLRALPDALHEADVVVHAAESPERFPRRVLEAWSCGTPVVAASSPRESSEFFRDGENCLTFPPGNATALAERLRRLLSDEELRATLVARAREDVVRRFALSYTVDQIEPEIVAAAEPGRT